MHLNAGQAGRVRNILHDGHTYYQHVNVYINITTTVNGMSCWRYFVLCMSVNLQHDMLLLEVNQQQHVVVGLPTCVVGGKPKTTYCCWFTNMCCWR